MQPPKLHVNTYAAGIDTRYAHGCRVHENKRRDGQVSARVCGGKKIKKRFVVIKLFIIVITVSKRY